MSTELKRIIEALLFVADAPLNLPRLCKLVESDDKALVRQALEDLSQEYHRQGRAMIIEEVAGGYRMRTRPELAGWIRRLARQQAARLSPAALETLAVIAYKQPVLKAEIERIRGVEVGGVLRVLMEKGLIRVVGRQDLPGRPLIYGTTPRFLETFGLKDLKDLPTLEEMEALMGGGEALPAEGGQTPAQPQLELKPSQQEQGQPDGPNHGEAPQTPSQEAPSPSEDTPPAAPEETSANDDAGRDEPQAPPAPSPAGSDPPPEQG